MSKDTSRLEVARKAYRKHTGIERASKPAPDGPASMEDLARMLMENTYADSWARDDLDLRTKCFLSMAITATLGTEGQFKHHLRAAHHCGVSKEEIVGMLIHFAGYLGAPRTAIARALVVEVWGEASDK